MSMKQPQLSAQSEPNSHSSFRFVRSFALDSLNVNMQEFEHKKTGAKHFHLDAENNENVFLVALKTVPDSSNGVAHILEHTSLCGSEKYPVRDPFFMMSRRSINTFMNAFTSSDWTAYPFSSMNNKDFNNLLDVYLDAVFFSRLDPLDFAQEGHRLEFSEPENTHSTLEYKGVVFNEMKGAMSSVTSQLWHTLGKYLCPSNTYHYNSGGDPQCIPDLTYEQLIDFYKTHYHPSNAIFMTFGDIPAEVHQQKFETQALNRFEKFDKKIVIPDTKRYFAPIKVQQYYSDNAPDDSNKTHIVMGWLLGKSTDLKHSLQAQLVASLLLDNSASPLMSVLESSDLGTSPSALCGVDDSQKEISFICGLEGCSTDSVNDVEAQIVDTMREVSENGVPKKDIESALHQLELHQREVGGDSYPYGLQLILGALNTAIHGGDAIQALDIDSALKQLREDVQDPNFLKNAIEEMFLNNRHRVTLSLVPDSNLLERMENDEVQTLARIKESLSEQEKTLIVEQTKQLKARQEQVDDESVLPKVTLADVPAQESYVNPSNVTTLGAKKLLTTEYNTPTNGLSYQQIIFPLPSLDNELTSIFPLYSNCLTECGTGDLDYKDAQRWQASASGGISAFSSIRTKPTDVHNVDGYFTFSGKALAKNHRHLNEILESFIQRPRFDEPQRLRELIAQIRSSKEQSITGNGHGLAMLAASSGFCSHAKLFNDWSGLSSIQNIKAVDESLNDSSAIDALFEKFSSAHKSITESKPQFLLVAEQQTLESMRENIIDTSAYCESSSTTHFELSKADFSVSQAWLTNSQVNFCAMAFPTVGTSHDDAAPLVILAGLMRNNFLHKAIREQGGAYGGGASQDSAIGGFKFYSYRDPRLEGTLDDFTRCIQWSIDENHSKQKLEEAILGTISSIDRSESPAGQAKRCFYQELHGRPLSARQKFREQILAVNKNDVQRVAEKYLLNAQPSIAVICDLSKQEAVKNLGLEPMYL